MKRHREVKVPDEPFVDWQRKRYTGPKADLSPQEHAEVETDRDLGKPVEQLLCDVYEGYTHWLRLESAPAVPGAMRTPVELILYTMCRSASMNAVVAKESAALQRSVRTLTWLLGVLTGILVLLGVAQIGLQWAASEPRSPALAVSKKVEDMATPSAQLPIEEPRNKETPDGRLEQPAEGEPNSGGTGAFTPPAQP